MADGTTASKNIVRKFGDEEIEVIYRKSSSPDERPDMFPPLVSSLRVEDGILIERNIAVPMRDGTLLYADIYRPEDGRDVPAILNWAPKGKNNTFQTRAQYIGPIHPEIFGEMVSEWTMQEGMDPAYWCHYGYAVINVDSRGIGNSEGDMPYYGSADALDCYDVIEWLAQQAWCNGRVAVAGVQINGMAPWYAAAERPPHLACIAPNDGAYDIYHAMGMRGGILMAGALEFIMDRLRGRGYIEDIVAMGHKYPFMNAYWEDKIAKVENIDIPVFSTINYNMHTSQSLDAFRRMPTKRKWLRTTNTVVEWDNIYCPDQLDELKRFFDRYLKNIRNGWESTPPIRLSVYDPAGTDVVNRVEQQWPPARAQHRKLYLDAATASLSPGPVEQEASVGYESDGYGRTGFTLTIDKETELLGYGKLRLWVEAEGADDMDLYITLQLIGVDGKTLDIPGYGHPHGGMSGLLRVSHRELDTERSTESEPYPAHRRQQLLSPGEIVPVDIPLFAFGYRLHPGQKLRVIVADSLAKETDPLSVELEKIGKAKQFSAWETINRGRHIIHTGGKYDSYLLVPETI